MLLAMAYIIFRYNPINASFKIRLVAISVGLLVHINSFPCFRLAHLLVCSRH